MLYAPAVSTGNPVVSESTQRSMWQDMVTFVPYVVFDIIVVAGVNAAYVYVAVYQSSALLLVVQTLLSIFKVIWGRWALPYILAVLTQSSKHGEGSNAQTRMHSGRWSFLLLLPIGMNSVIGSDSGWHSVVDLSATPNIPASEMNALYNLYNATKGEDWLWNEDFAAYGIPWNSPTPQLTTHVLTTGRA
eukprot:gene9846-11559_t